MIHPTDEQLHALELAKSRASFKVMAYAGSGKTTTLQLISESMGQLGVRRGLYAAFNKSIASEAASRFGAGVDCRTLHSLAYRFVHRSITAKLSRPKLTPSMMAKAYGLEALQVRRPSATGTRTVDLSAAQQASMISEGLRSFCSTHAKEPAPRHLRLPDWLESSTEQALRARLFPLLQRAWYEAVDPQHDFGISHDIYLKLWALSNPKLPYDYVLFDEAQDADPLMLGVLLAQNSTQVIYVGDAHQQIYEWRGATNAMQKLPLPSSRLTQSFRFGENIAHVANQL